VQTLARCPGLRQGEHPLGPVELVTGTRVRPGRPADQGTGQGPYGCE